MSGSNRLPVLAAEIAQAHGLCRDAVGDAVRHAVEAGRALVEAKGLVAHGEWQGWLRANVPGVSIRTAQRYMRAAERAGENDTVTFSSLRELLRPRRRAAPEPADPGGCEHPEKAMRWHHHEAGSSGRCERCGFTVFLTVGQLQTAWDATVGGQLGGLDLGEVATAFGRPGGGAIKARLAATFDGLCGMVLHLRAVRERLTPEQYRGWLRHEFGLEAEGAPETA